MSLSLLLALQREKRNPSTNIISIPINQQKIKMVVFSFEYCINNEIEIKVHKCLKHVFKCNFPLMIFYNEVNRKSFYHVNFYYVLRNVYSLNKVEYL